MEGGIHIISKVPGRMQRSDRTAGWKEDSDGMKEKSEKNFADTHFNEKKIYITMKYEIIIYVR